MNGEGHIELERRLALYERIWAGPMFSQWHWLRWNFDQIQVTRETYFAQYSLNALIRCDEVMPGFAHEMLDRLATLGGTEESERDRAQILSWLAEVLVIHHFVRWQWVSPVTFDHEPTVVAGGMNPEVVINGAGWRFGIEVKSPDLLEFAKTRRTCESQYLARVEGGQDPAQIGAVLYPRDNPVKDFLRSANAKFEGFREDPTFFSALFIVWDDFINEPLSALLSPASGLLTPRSFDRDDQGDPQFYPAVDAVVMLRHQHQFALGMANRPAEDERTDFLDYGAVDQFPPNAVVPLVTGREPPDEIVDALQAVLPEPRMGAEYVPAELVWWLP